MGGGGAELDHFTWTGKFKLLPLVPPSPVFPLPGA